MIVPVAASMMNRRLSRYGLVAALIVSAALWPQHSDECLVGAGILLGLSMAMRSHSRAAASAPAPEHCSIDALRPPRRSVALRTGAGAWRRHTPWRNELTGELLERSRLRMTTTVARKRGHRGSPVRIERRLDLR